MAGKGLRGLCAAEPLRRDRTAKLEKALDICCNTEKKLVVTTDKDGATSEEFTTYLLDTLKAL